MRPISNVVDATNYVMLALGSPLHAFDQSKLAEGRIVVRRAHADEEIRTLDGTLRTLTPEDLVIADAARPVAIAGVMGGEDSEVTDETTVVLLEAANFEPSGIQRTSERLGLRSEASRPVGEGRRPSPRRGRRPSLQPALRELAGAGWTGESDVSRRAARTGRHPPAPRAHRRSSSASRSSQTSSARYSRRWGSRSRATGTSPCRPGAPATSLARSTWSRRSAG